MYPPVVAKQLRARGRDVVSAHDPEYRRLEGAPDEEIFAVALAEERALVTENVPDFWRLEADTLTRGEAHATLVFSSNRQFPRGEPGTTGRLVEALHALITEGRHSAARSSSSGRGRDDRSRPALLNARPRRPRCDVAAHPFGSAAARSAALYSWSSALSCASP